MNFVRRTVAESLFVLWIVLSITFLLLRALPGDAISSTLLDSGASAEVIEMRRAALGLDAPVMHQYLVFISGVLRFDFGVSLLDGQPVLAKVAQQWKYTFELAVISSLIAVSAGVVLGITGAGIAVGKNFAAAANLAAAVLQSVPIYWLGTLVIIVFAVILDWFPASGASSPGAWFLPALTLGLSGAAGIARVSRAAFADAQRAGYFQTAAAKGLTEKRIALRHMLPNALPPIITAAALNTGFVLSGTVLVETVFNRPGVGRLLLDSILRGDLPVVQGVACLTVIVFTLLLLWGRLMHHLIDPRLRIPER